MSVFTPVVEPVMRRVFRPAFGLWNGSGLPKLGLLAWCANRFDPEQLAFLDKIGGSVRPLHDLQYIQADGTGYFVNAALVTAGITVTSVTGSGTTTYSSPSAGRINMTAGAAWDFTVTWSDAVVSEYKFASRTGETAAVVHDVSGNGRHLTVTGFADITGPCSSGKEIGSDWINLMGFSEDSTTYSYDTIIPASTTPGIDALGNALTYPGRAKYNPLPKSAPCIAFDGTGYLAVKKNGVDYTLTGSTIENGGTATLAISTSSITCTGTGTGFNIRITESGGNIITFPCSNGRGTETSPNLIVHGYDTAGANYEATCTSFVSNETIWSTQSEYFHELTYGYSDGGLGPELVKNGSFSDTSSWSVVGVNISINSGKATWNIAAANERIMQSILTIGATYYVKYEVVEYTSGSIYPISGFDSIVGNTIGEQDGYGVATSVLLYIRSGGAGFSGSIDNVSVKRSYPLTVKIPANPYTPGLDCLGNELTNPPLKWNDSAYYTMPDADQIREALGWAYGTASDEYDADGTPMEKTLAELETLGVGPRLYFGSKGLAIYDTDQTTTDAKIKSVLGV